VSASGSNRRHWIKRRFTDCVFKQDGKDTTRVFLFALSLQPRQSASFADPGIFRQQKATATGKATSAAADRTAHPLSDPNKSSGTNFGGEDLRPTSSTPVSARGNSQGPEKRIDDIRNLSLEQVKSKERKERPVSVNNPRKRGAEGGSGSPDPPAGGYKVESMSTRLRHGNTLSGSRDAEPGRRGTLPDEPDYKRGFTGYKQLLWDPETDSPNTTKVVRREKQRGHNKPNDWRHPSGDFHSPEKGSVLSEKDNAYPHAHVGHEKPQLQQAPGSHDGPGSSFPFEKDRDDLSSGSPLADDVPEDEHPEASEGDPEMLLQPETRPISHEQLVVEVKGIYAGLVMVEAKCIDIDERQSAAAQERDPSKRPELKNDQWQSLIALHKQVHHTPKPHGQLRC